MKKILLAHPGTQHSYFLAAELYKRKGLHRFHTCIGFTVDMLLLRILKIAGGRQSFSARIIKGLPRQFLRLHPVLELMAMREKRKGMVNNDVFYSRNIKFQESIPESEIMKADALIGFDTSSIVLIKKAQKLQKKFFLEQTIGHPLSAVRILKNLEGRFYGWEHSWSSKPDRDISNEKQEHDSADVIVVPGEFVKNTLIENGVDPLKIKMNSFGTDTSVFYPAEKYPETNPFILLFVGSITVRKGVPLLLEAWQRINPPNAELWLAGPGRIPAQQIKDIPSSVKILGKVNRSEISALFRKAHVFVFPSYFEGQAIVQLEAAASGLPIIGTTASGATEIVEEGKTGFVIEPGNTDQLVDKIKFFIADPQRAKEMFILASLKSKQWDWSRYGDRWEKIIMEK